MRKNMFIYSSFPQSLGCMQMMVNISMFQGYLHTCKKQKHKQAYKYIAKERAEEKEMCRCGWKPEEDLMYKLTLA